MVNAVNYIANTELGLVLVQRDTYLLVETARDLDREQVVLRPRRPGAIGEYG